MEKELHMAGHCINVADGVRILIDDHGSPVAPAVWGLYESTIRRFPHAVTLIEWDSNLPPLSLLASPRRRKPIAGGKRPS